MRAQRDPRGQRQIHRPRHRIRVACVKSAGNIGRAHDLQQRRILPHHPRAKAFAHISVQIDRLHGKGSISRPAVTPLIS
jgi:hypothetical protein